MIGLLLLSLAGLGGFAWWSLVKAKEQARYYASRVCREQGLVLMDDTVMLDTVQFNKDSEARGWRLRYGFEFAQRGVLHRGGSVLIAPGKRTTVVIATSDGKLIQEV